KVGDLSSRNEVVDFRLQAGHFLVNSDKKVTKEAPPRRRRPLIAKSRSAIRGSPALLARGGVRRQAIPGLSADASASLPRPARTHAPAHAATSCGARRRQRGGTSTATAQVGTAARFRLLWSVLQTPQYHKSIGELHIGQSVRRNEILKFILHFSSWRQPMYSAFRGFAWAFDLAFDVPSPLSAPSTAKPERQGLAPVGARRGRMPKRPQTGQGWPVCGPRSGCGAQGNLLSRFFFCDRRAQTPGRRFFGYFGDYLLLDGLRNSL